ncbi:SGNH/GDSL hydrolase family protein, partial [Roseateles sp. GG27B]
MPASTLAGLAMLVIGESHLSQANYLINPLYENLSAQGAKVHAIGACGASAGATAVIKGRDAVTTPIKQLIATDKPDVVVIIIGDTMASYDKPAFPRAWAWQGVTSLAKEVAATKTTCVWVGPPWGQPGGKYQ